MKNLHASLSSSFKKVQILHVLVELLPAALVLQAGLGQVNWEHTGDSHHACNPSIYQFGWEAFQGQVKTTCIIIIPFLATFLTDRVKGVALSGEVTKPTETDLKQDWSAKAQDDLNRNAIHLALCVCTVCEALALQQNWTASGICSSKNNLSTE